MNNLPDKSSSLENRTDITDQNKKKPKLDTRQNVTIIGDNYQLPRRKTSHEQKEDCEN